MIDISLIRKDPKMVKEKARLKGVEIDVKKILILDEERKKFKKEIDFLRKKRNEISEKISKEKEKKKIEEFIKEAKEIKEEIQDKEKVLREIENRLKVSLSEIPNLPLDDVPPGKDEKDNLVIKEVGKKPKFDFLPKSYLELANKLDLVDVFRSGKVSGSRFGYLKNEAVLLEFALIKFTYDLLLPYGFVPLIPPVMIRPEMMYKMGYLIKAPEEGYFIEKDNLFLVGTSEQSIGPYHGNEILKEEELPKRYLGFSTCFRREAGSYGKETFGIFRVHQFDKIEMFSFSHPQKSKEEHQFFLNLEEMLMRKLKLPYRVVRICSGEMAFPTASQYDIEAWIPSKNGWRETHSSSNCTDFQARRLNIRFRKKDGKCDFVHTVNGTAFAIGRILIAIFENYQTKEGTIKIPPVLFKYLNFKEIKR